MRLWDISLPVSPSLPTWPGDGGVGLKRTQSMAEGASANVSHLSCSVHTGTHLDAPSHYIDGAATADEAPLDVLTGPAYVAHVPDVGRVTPEELEGLDLPQGTTRLLLRTRNSEIWGRDVVEFTPDYVALTTAAAEWVVQRGIRLIGVDYLSVQLFSDAEPLTHRTLLGAGVVVIEGLDLSQVAPGTYRLFCLPLKLVGSDGAPARAILLEE